MKRDNFEFLIASLDGLRRDDRKAMRGALAEDAVWQGLCDEWRCDGKRPA